MLTKLAILLVVVACAWGQPINLKPYNLTAAAMFYLSDANKDGILVLSEVESNFKGYDQDGDGRISRYEYTSYVDQHSPQLHAFSHGLYDIYDVDNDGVLDLHDYDAFFNLMDGNGDGIVVENEYIRYWVILLETLEHLHGGGRKKSTF